MVSGSSASGTEHTWLTGSGPQSEAGRTNHPEPESRTTVLPPRSQQCGLHAPLLVKSYRSPCTCLWVSPCAHTIRATGSTKGWECLPPPSLQDLKGQEQSERHSHAICPCSILRDPMAFLPVVPQVRLKPASNAGLLGSLNCGHSAWPAKPSIQPQGFTKHPSCSSQCREQEAGRTVQPQGAARATDSERTWEGSALATKGPGGQAAYPAVCSLPLLDST